MADQETIAARQALCVSTFARLKELVRELEDEEKRLGRHFGPSEIEFKLSPNEVAWYVAYKTVAESMSRVGEVAASTSLDERK
jgi:hypothetical protein